MMKKGDFPYWQTEEFDRVVRSAPDIVLILTGTNDSKDWNWFRNISISQNTNKSYVLSESRSHEFVLDCIDMIHTFQDLDYHPAVFAIIPPPLYKGSDRNYKMSQQVVNTEFPSLTRAIAKNTSLSVIDVFSRFASHCPDFTSGDCGWISSYDWKNSDDHDDGCHPNAAGYKQIAQAVQQALVQSPLTAQVIESDEVAFNQYTSTAYKHRVVKGLLIVILSAVLAFVFRRWCSHAPLEFHYSNVD